MKLIKIFSLLIFFCYQYTITLFAQDVKLSVDIGGTAFEYLEPIYMKVYIENNTVGDIIIESWSTAPEFQFILKNSENTVFKLNEVTDRVFVEKTLITIEQGVRVYWPNRYGYYSLSLYYLENRYGLYLPEDEYTLSVKIDMNIGSVESTPIRFKVIKPKNVKAFQLYTEAFDMVWGTKDDTGYIAGLEKIRHVAPTSVYNTLALHRLYGRYIWGRKQYEKREELIDKMIEQMTTNLPGNRYTLGLALRFLRSNSKRSEVEKRNILQNLLNKSSNPEVQREIRAMLGLYVQKGFRTKTIRVDTLAPPPPTRH